nr:plasmid mobilization relaxosome protein MobC [Ruminococcus albus]
MDEWKEVERKAAECNMKTPTYIKYMALHGKIVNVDAKMSSDLLAALGRVGNNVNQIAHRANITEYITREDLQSLMKWRDGLRHTSRAYLSTIHSALGCST